MSRTLAAALGAYTAGIIIGWFFTLPFAIILAAGLAFLAMGVYCQLRGWNKNSTYYLLAIFALGMFMYHWQVRSNQGNIAYLADQEVEITGVVCAEPEVKVNGVNYILQVAEIITPRPFPAAPDVVADGEPPKGKIMITVKGPGGILSYGDLVQVSGIAEVPNEPGNPGEFNYRKYLQDRGIQLTMKSWAGSSLKKIGTGRINPMVDLCLRAKHRLTRVLAQTMSREHAGLTEGILFGASGFIDPAAKNDFALTGVVHILSVSGYHLGVVTGLCLLLGSTFSLGRGTTGLLTVAVTAVYVIMTGASPPVVRAAVMAWVLLLARYSRMDYDWLNAMSFAALLILLFDPAALFNAGFQLSFIATWGILYLAPLLRAALINSFSHVVGLFFDSTAKSWNLSAVPGGTVFLFTVGQAALVTLAAQIAVLPVTAYYFNYISVISLPANLVIVPLISLAMLLGGVAAVSGLVWLPLGEIINISTGSVLDFVLAIAHLLAKLPFAVLTIGQPSIFAAALFYLLMILVVETRRNLELNLRVRRYWSLYKVWLVNLLLVLITVFIWVSILLPPNGRLKITFLDIGQGDAALVETPQGRHILVDTGGNEQKASTYLPGEKILLPYLRRQGIDSLDLVLLSHAHADHIQGAESLLGRIDVKMLGVNRQFRQSPAGAKLVRQFAARGTEIRQVAGGDKIMCEEDIIFEVLYPDEGNASSEGENHDSLLLRLSYNEFQALLTGDAEGGDLSTMAGERADVEAEIVKIPHHGSKNSWVREFYRLAHPDTAVISVGPNYYGHPSDEVLQGLAGLGVKVLRTDLDGAVIVSSDGHGYDIQTGKVRL